MKRNIPKAIRKLSVPKKSEERKYDPTKQVEGLKKRLDATGIDSEKATDNRNFLEKALNLTPDQNALFDFFEILDRPQRALFGAINAAQTGDDIGKAALDGLTRKDGAAVKFKDILHEAGMEDSEGSFGIDDALGFAGEVFLDPMDLALIPVTGGGKLAADAAKGLADANKALEAAKAAGDAAKIADATKTVSDAKKAIEAASSTTRMISGTEAVMGGLKRGFKGTAKVADRGITTLLGKIDDISATSAQAATELGKVKESLELAQGYKNFKDGMVKIFDAAKALPAGIWERATKVRGAENLSEAQLGILQSAMVKDLDETAVKMGITSDALGKDVQTFIEMNHYKPKGTLFDTVLNPKQPLNSDMVKKISPLMEQAGIKFKDVYAETTLENGVQAYVVKNQALHNEFVKYLEGNKNVFENIQAPILVPYKDAGYHAGDLGKAESYSRINTGNRHTGHFGTGTYFVGDKSKLSGSYADRPVSSVDFSQYNLYKPSSNSKGYALHDALKTVNRDLDYYGVDISKSIETLDKVKASYVSNLDYDLVNENFDEVVDSLNNVINAHNKLNPNKPIDLLAFDIKDVDIADLDEELDYLTVQLTEKYSKSMPYTEAWDKAYDEAYAQTFGKLEDAVYKIQDVYSDMYSKGILSNLEYRSSDANKIVDKLYDAMDGKHSKNEIKNAIDKAIEKREKVYSKKKIDLTDVSDDSLSTIIMKELGYEGIDVRHLSSDAEGLAGLDNTGYGSVIYDLKGKDLKTRESLSKYRKDLETSKILFDEMDMPRFYSDSQIDRINKLYNDSEDFRGIVDRSLSLQQQMLETMDTAFDALTEGYGTKFATATPEGFVRHAATQEYKEIPRKVKPYYEEFAGSRLRGNMDAFTGRAYKMSAEEANMIAKAHIDTALNYGDLSSGAREFWSNQSNVKMFEETLQKSTADFIATAPRFAKDVKMIDEVLAKGFILDSNVIKPLEVGEKIPRGYTRVSKTDLSRKLKGMSQYVENPDVMIEALKKLPDSPELVIDNNVFEMVGRLGEPKQANVVVTVLDKINDVFKRNKLLSPGFQMRNFTGNFSNMYLSGVPINDIMPNFTKADSILRKGDELLMKETLGEVLSSADAEALNLYKEFIQNGFHKASGELWEIPEDILKKNPGKENILKEIQKVNNAANEAADRRFRLALMMYAKENPDIYRKVGVNSPAAFVRHVLFDPNDLSSVEKNTLKRVVPFYTFAKKNLAFQLKNFTDNPVQYKRLKKSIESLWDIGDIDVNDIEAYKRENFWIPIPGMSKDGKYVALKTNLPVGDLAEFTDSPLRRVVSSLSPAIRAPFELTANKQMFTNMPIQEFKGQKGYIIPELTRKQEYLLSQTGLDVPVATGADLVRGVGNLAKGNLQGGATDFIDQTVGRSLFSSGDVEKAKISKAYDEVRRIEGLIKYYKQEGVDIKTLRDIQNENKNLNNALKRLRSVSNQARR